MSAQSERMLRFVDNGHVSYDETNYTFLNDLHRTGVIRRLPAEVGVQFTPVERVTAEVTR